MRFTGLKSRCQQSRAPLGVLGQNPFSCLFQFLEAIVGVAPSFSFKARGIGPTQIIQDKLPI